MGGQGVLENVPTLTITAPNGAETWYIGSSREISWTSTGTVGKVRIEYSLDGGSSWSVIADSTANDGAHTWTVPDSAATTYRVRISEAVDGDPRDVSDTTFTVEREPTLTLTSTIGGETWSVGSTQQVTWNSTGAIDSVRVELSGDSGETWTVVAPKAPNSGTFSMVVPDAVSENCLVRIGDCRREAVTARSEAAFAIAPPAAVLGWQAVPRVSGVLGMKTDRLRGVVSIAYGLAASEMVTIRFYNLTGALVAAPTPTVKPAGYHTYEWRGSGNGQRTLGAGMYFVHVKLGDMEYRGRVSVVR